MFDNVICEVELPDGWKPDVTSGENYFFQTKSFEQTMDTYKITADGRLEVFEYNIVDTGRWYRFEKDDEGNPLRVEYDEKPEGNDLFGPYPIMKRINEQWVEIHYRDGSKYSDRFNFYSSDKDGNWHEYFATFDNGQLIELKGK